MSEIRIPPFWRVLSELEARSEFIENPDLARAIVLTPGEGWGGGDHPTTQLCLQALTLFAPKKPQGFRMLDFGSGSGILSMGAAKLGATVDAVEIDDAAIENARENARLNGVETSIRFSREIETPPASCDLVVANILRPILLEFAEAIARPLRDGGVLILSGLVATDVPEISVRYSPLLSGREPFVHQRGEWRALVWR